VNAAPEGVSRAQCESPIERRLIDALREEIVRCRLRCVPVAQAQLGPFRADILLQIGNRKLVVECDGAAYHAANKDQVARDKRRDRFFAARNISVMRFAGAEINRCPRACAAEIGAWLEAAASAHKTGIMDKFALGEISALQACRLIRRSGLVAA
jgi:very-short-patch-repair endonuclease